MVVIETGCGLSIVKVINWSRRQGGEVDEGFSPQHSSAGVLHSEGPWFNPGAVRAQHRLLYCLLVIIIIKVCKGPLSST